jgi:hypothetical protein
MKRVLSLWRDGSPWPIGWAGEGIALDPWHAPDDLAADIADWLQAHPWAWVMAKGPGAAIFLHMAARRLDLRIAGVVLIEPQDWLSVHGRLALSDAPLSFPAALFPTDATGQVVTLRERRLATSLKALMGGAMPKRGPMSSSKLHEMVLAREAQLQAATSDGSAAKAASDFRSSTAAMASRTSSMVRRTMQVASSPQSAQGT